MSENISPEPVVKKKRGRKKKSELEQLAKENEIRLKKHLFRKKEDANQKVEN